MKKNLLFLIGLILIAAVAFGQGLQLSDDAGDVASGAVFNVTGAASGALVFDHLYVQNITDTELYVYAKKIILQEGENTMNTFCWADLCYAPQTLISPNPDTLGPGETAIDFKGEYYPGGFEGITSMYYVWFAEGNENDSVFVKVNFNTSIYGQSLQLTDGENLIPNGYEFTMTGRPDETISKGNVYVENISDMTIDVLCKKVIIDTVPNTFNSFCWADLCYGPATYVSPEFKTLAPAEMAMDFKGDYIPNTQVGTSTIMYVFFNRSDEADSAYITVNFTAESTQSVNDLYAADFISAPYPNPAREVVYFDLEKDFGGEQLEISIRNLLGAEVKRLQISGNESRISFSTSDLKDGMYLYSVIANGRIVTSNKLIVKH